MNHQEKQDIMAKATPKRQIIVSKTTREERENLAKKVNNMLINNNYGFFHASDSDIENIDNIDHVTYDNVTQLLAIKELHVRLAVFVETGRNDSGKINFPECQRTIEYILSGDSISNCSIKMKALGKKKFYIYEN